MRRVKKHKYKQGQPEASTSGCSNKVVEHDLKYYAHDRIELIQQVFSILRPEDIRAMAPRHVKDLPMNIIKEKCTEELLGISTKRLYAIIDGVEQPSSTTSSSSSSPAKAGTISLESISSDEEILNEEKKVKRKHRHRRRKKTKKSKQKRKPSPEKSGKDRPKPIQTGLRVLELLELQSRAGAIKAQLQEESTDVINPTGTPAEKHASEDEVKIKEEPAEVIEISSEDEKPNVEDLQREIVQTSKNSTESLGQEGRSVIKRTNDLVITIPQAKPTCKIKLKRNKSHTKIQNPDEASRGIIKTQVQSSIERTGQEMKRESNPKTPDKANKNQDKPVITQKKSEPTKKVAVKEKQKKKGKEKKKKKGKQMTKEDGSDHDEITLKLSDSEKVDLLEELDRKIFDNISSSCLEDSQSSLSSKDDNGSVKTLLLSTIDVVEKKISDKEDHIHSSNKEEDVSVA